MKPALRVTVRITNSSPVAADDEECGPGNIDAAPRLTSSRERGREAWLGRACRLRERVVIVHFFSPFLLVELVISLTPLHESHSLVPRVVESTCGCERGDLVLNLLSFSDSNA